MADKTLSTNQISRIIRNLKLAKRAGILDTQQFKTLKGQVLKGDLEGANKGFIKIQNRKMGGGEISKTK